MTDSENSAGEPKKSFWVTLLRPKVALPLGLLVLILLSPVLYRGWNLGHIPDLGDPFPEEFLEKPELPEEENAWVYYQRAEELRTFPNPKTAIIPSVSYPLPWMGFREIDIDVEQITIWDDSLHERNDSDKYSRLNLWKETLRDNHDALIEWKAGTEKTKYKSLTGSVQKTRESRIASRFYPKLSELQTQAVAKAGQLASQGKHSDALDWMLAVYRFSRHLTQSGGTDNWERAIEVSQGVFEALDELLDDDAYTHEDLIAFLREFEQAYNLTGDFDQALVDDYLTLRQQILNVHELNTKYREEIEVGSSVNRKNRFEMYVEGEPQLSLRLLQHHFEYLKRNLGKPVEDRVMSISWSSWPSLDKMDQLKQLYRDSSVSNEMALSSDNMEAGIQRAILIREIIDQNYFFSKPFLREEDNMLFESLRILIAAHAFFRRYPPNTNLTDKSFITLNGPEQIQVDALPLGSLEELVKDSLIDVPHDPYDSTSHLIMAVCRDGEVFIVSSLSEEYERLASGDPPESLHQERFTAFNYVPFPPTIPVIDTWKFQLPTAASRESLPVNDAHIEGLQWVQEFKPEKVEFLRVLH